MPMPRAVSQLRPREILHLSASQQQQRGIRIGVPSHQRVIRDLFAESPRKVSQINSETLKMGVAISSSH